MGTIRKYLVALMVSLMLLTVTGCGSGGSEVNTADTEETENISEIVDIEPVTVDVSKVYEGFIDSNYSDLDNNLKALGFENVDSYGLEDLESSDDPLLGCVDSISIDGITDFEDKTVFDSTAEVKIAYHSVKNAEFPLDVKEAENLIAESVIDELAGAGFNNVAFKEIQDIEPGTVDFKTEIEVADLKDANKSDKLPIDTPITVISHKPYTIYNCLFKVEVDDSKTVDKYELAVSFGNNKETLKNTESKDISFDVKEGDYTLLFEKSDDPDLKSSIDLHIDCNLEASYTLSVSSDSIVLNENYYDRLEELPEDKVKIYVQEYDFMGINYEDTVNSLREIGFTNITSEPVYDAYPGSKKEYKTADVTIDGSDRFVPREIYNKDSAVVVTYHLLKESNPADQIVIAKSSDEYNGQNFEDTIKELKDLGFMYVNTKAKKLSYSEENEKLNNTVYDIKCGNAQLSIDDVIYKGKIIYVYYYRTETEKLVNVESIYDSLVGSNYKDVVSKLKAAGFENVESQANVVLMSTRADYMSKDEKTTEILVDGQPLTKEIEYKTKASVTVYYELAQKIKVPFSEGDTEGLNFEKVIKMYQDAGFTNIDPIGHEGDYDPKIAPDGSVVVSSINENSNFDKDDEFYPFDYVKISYRIQKKADPSVATSMLLYVNGNYSGGYWQFYEGDAKTTYITYEPSTATKQNITYKSSDTSVATVDSNGKITAVSSGTVTITATGKGISDYVSVKVSKKATASASGSGSGGYGNGSSTSSGTSSGSGTTYVVNVKSKIFHRTSCASLPTTNRKDVESTREELINQGYKACKNCKP